MCFGQIGPAPKAPAPKAWTAQWIAAPDGPGRDQDVLYFRRAMAVESVPEHLLVDVSADTRFELHVNGRRVGAGPALGDVHHWRYEVFDLAPFLHVGANQIAAVVWNYGTAAAVAQMSSRTAFLLSAEDPAQAALSTGGAGWETRQETGRGLGQAKVSGYYAAGPPERMDGRQIDWQWDAAGDDDRMWRPARSLGRAALREVQDGGTPWMLVGDELPPMRYEAVSAGEVVRTSGLQPGTATLPGMAALPGTATLPSTAALMEQPITIPAHSDVTLLLDRKLLTTAFPSLQVSGGRDAHITLTYAEALYDEKGNKGNRNEIEGRHIAGLRDEIVTDGGSGRTYRPLWWRTWRYLQVEVKTEAAALTLEKIGAFYTAYPFSAVGHFASDDPELTRIWETGWRTAQLCAHETYMDTPYWEQLQYFGDTRIQALISYGVAGDDRLARQALAAAYDSLLPEGLTQSRYPSSLTQIIPPFSLLWVGMLDDFWQYRGDEGYVRSLLPGTRGVLDWFAARQRPDGLLGTIAWWPFVDWSPPAYVGGVPPQDADGGSSALTLQYIEALRDAAAMEDRFGERARASGYRERAARAARALMRESWDDGAGLLADTPAKRQFSQQANALAVWLDVIPRARQAAVMREVLAAGDDAAPGSAATAVSSVPMSKASYYFRFYLARAMVHAGMGDRYLGQLGPWRKMLAMGLSTWAENPEPTRSDSHAWSAHPTLDFAEIVAGIEPGAPGFSRVEIAPHLGALGYVEASMPTPHGLVEVSYRKANGRWAVAITLPAGVSGMLHWDERRVLLHPGLQRLQFAAQAAVPTAKPTAHQTNAQAVAGTQTALHP